MSQRNKGGKGRIESLLLIKDFLLMRLQSPLLTQLYASLGRGIE
jgi:hypothetical protein